MGLFDKKQCSVCGGDAGTIFSKKLADGYLCKECASKLSPYFTGRKKSSTEDIKAQLEYRHQNEANLANLNPKKVMGFDKKIYLDEVQKKFVVSSSSDFRKGNPDIIDLSMMKACELIVNEEHHEIYKDEEKEESYDPKRYESEYEFEIDMEIDHPYFDSIKIDLKDGDPPTSKDDEKYKNLYNAGFEIQSTLMPGKYTMPVELTATSVNNSEEWECPDCHTMNSGKFCMNCGKPKAVKWFCPNCGKENEGNFCMDCGTKKPANAGK